MKGLLLFFLNKFNKISKAARKKKKKKKKKKKTHGHTHHDEIKSCGDKSCLF